MCVNVFRLGSVLYATCIAVYDVLTNKLDVLLRVEYRSLFSLLQILREAYEV